MDKMKDLKQQIELNRKSLYKIIAQTAELEAIDPFSDELYNLFREQLELCRVIYAMECECANLFYENIKNN